MQNTNLTVNHQEMNLFSTLKKMCLPNNKTEKKFGNAMIFRGLKVGKMSHRWLILLFSRTAVCSVDGSKIYR